LGLKFGFDLDGAWNTPSEHLAAAVEAERLGFESVWMGDHFMPWFDKDAQAPAVWPWLGAALAKTTRIKIGPAVNVPIGGRYHPLLVAQAAATLDRMFPGRFLMGVGTGQSMSEKRFLGAWPGWKERSERLSEAVRLMKKAWTSAEYFDWEGRYFPTDNVFLYTKPAGRIELYFSARGVKMSKIAGSLGDHLMTTVSEPAKVRPILEEFSRAVRESGRDPERSHKIGYFEFGLGDVDQLVKLLRESSAAQGMSEEARSESDPRAIQKMGLAIPADQLVKHHHLVRKAEELVPDARALVDAGCDYIVFSDESRAADTNMRKIMDEVVPQLRR
jgi:G6PDH family F420-dependent oxidoreductase